MKLGEYRFTVTLLLLILLIGGAMASYFTFLVPSSKPMDLASIMKVLNLDFFAADEEPTPPGQEVDNQEGKSPDHAGAAVANGEKQGRSKTVRAAPVQFPGKGTKAGDYKAEFSLKVKEGNPRAEFKALPTTFNVIIPPKLAPNMFSFSQLPYDAPAAVFPLVLVGQRNLEWVPTIPGGRIEGAVTPVYAAPRPTPSTPTPTPSPNPGPTPTPTPPPQPEVSTSGL